MLLPLLLALSVPPSFAQVVQARAAATHMHVVAWWSDDLDGDGTPESIALVCNGEAGIYLVQHGKDLLEAHREVDGRNNCTDAEPTLPAFTVTHDGAIHEGFEVHHGRIDHALAIRAGKLVQVSEHDESFEIDHDARIDETDDTDFEALTWHQRIEPEHGRVKATSGPLVLVTAKVQRATTLPGGVTIAATRAEDAPTTLHVHAPRPVLVRDCTDKPCKTTRLPTGDHDLDVGAANELTVIAGRTSLVHLLPIEGDSGYPPPSEQY